MMTFNLIALVVFGVFIGLLLAELFKTLKEYIALSVKRFVRDVADEKITAWDRWHRVVSRIITLESRDDASRTVYSKQFNDILKRLAKLEADCKPKEGGCCDTKTD